VTARQRRFVRAMRARGSTATVLALVTEAAEVCQGRRAGVSQRFAAAGLSGGRAEARLAERTLCPAYYVPPGPPHTAAPAPAPPPPSPAPAPQPASCYPTTSSGNCYQPGEFCSVADHGVSGIDANGDPITCEDNNGWRWEPS
jgi:hypothetical protein